MGAIKDYWHTWLWRDMTTRIITVNTIVWIVIAGGMLLLPERGHNFWLSVFALPPTIFALPERIWTVGTFMVSQYDFLHLLVNMMWLLLFGHLYEQLRGGNYLLGLYVVSGLAGAAAFIIANTVHPGHQFMLGASCSVVGVVGACAVLMPSWRVNLLLFGAVKVVWIAVAAIVLFVLLEPAPVVSIAHAAGLAAGLATGLSVKRNWGAGPSIKFGPLRRPQRETYADDPDESPEEQMDRLLQKVSRSGYSSLSPAERQRLFELSQRIKR